MPKKPTSLKESSLRNPIGVPIETKKKKNLKESLKEPIEKNKKSPIGQKETSFEKAMNIFGNQFSKADDKSGFEQYKAFRDVLVETLCHSENATTFVSGTDSIDMSTIHRFNLIEQAYLDNFLLSMTIRSDSPSMYSKLIPIIDSYIKPQKQRQGFSAFKEEMAGLFVYALSLRNEASSRQLINAASQIFNMSETYVKNAFYRISSSLGDEGISIQKDYIAILALYIALHFMGDTKMELGAIVKGHSRSEKELKMVEESLTNFNQEIIESVLPEVILFTKKHPNGFITKILDGYSINLKLPIPDVFNAFCLLAATFCIRNLPNQAAQDIPIDML
ncbi:MAG: hypothetical protein IAE63_00920 [Alphaproteobacteria bacterium]|nr:hypothetical protein [Alphaproteobacteria bacterium]